MQLSELPEINFIDVDAQEMIDNAKSIVESILERKLADADPLMLFVKSFVAILAQQSLLINELCKQNLLAYATGEYLEHIAALYGLERQQATYAKTTLEVRLSAPRETATVIMGGTRVNAGNDVNFATDSDLIFVAGEVEKNVSATCTEAGEIGNGYAAGELNLIVDPQPFLLSIVNLTTSEGGSDIETDEDFRERVHIAPESFSTAGPAGAYEYFAKKASNDILDVYVESLNPGEVDVYVLMAGGELPSTEMLDLVSESLNERSIRPLTDLVKVFPPVVINYDLECSYWISRNDATQAASIKQAADKAIEEYILWQRGRFGRDIEPTELYYRLRAAGVNRAEVLEPRFIGTPPNSIAIPRSVKVNYRGLKDD